MEKMDYENYTGQTPRKTSFSFYTFKFITIIILVVLLIFAITHSTYTTHQDSESIPWNLADPGPHINQHFGDLRRLGILILSAIKTLWYIHHPQAAPVLPTPTLPISRNSIIICSSLGHGSFGQVYSGFLHGKPCAMKTMINSNIMEKEEFFHEEKLMNHIDHENIITSFGIFYHIKYPFIFMEMATCSLLKYLEVCLENKIEISNKVKLQICHDIAKGAVELRSLNIVHRDLAARNILMFLDDNDHLIRAKIADFGMARKMVKHGPFEHGYQDSSGYYSEKTDVFSFGKIMEFIFSYHPSSVNTDFVPDGIHKIINNCCNPDLALRPTFLFIFRVLTHYIYQNEYMSKAKQI